LAITEIRSDESGYFLSKNIPAEDAFLVTLQLRDFPNHQYWEDGRAAPVSNLRAGDTTLYDLKRDPVVLLDKPFHSMHFYLPRVVLNAIADDTDVTRIGDLAYQPGAGVVDDTMRGLIGALAAAFVRPEEVGQVFTDYMTLAIAAHVAQAYGGMGVEKVVIKGGLSPWQERRSTELLASRLAGELAIVDLARECGLSQRHFCRAFRRSTGLSPHAWLQLHRIEQAKSLLAQSRLSLAEVGAACGFASQSHFTRIFTQLTRASPGAWRRANGSTVSYSRSP
jgi:AraC-like DNA-binding protein